MRVTLRFDDKDPGTAEWDALPAEGDIIPLQSATRGTVEVRRVEKVESNPSSVSIVHLGAARPNMLYQAGAY